MRDFLKGVLLGIGVYLVINIFSYLLALPIFLGYYLVPIFSLIGGVLFYLKGKKYG